MLTATKRTKVKQLLAEQLGVDESEVLDTAKLQDDLGADSLDIVEIVMTVEEAFNIEIPDSAAEKFVTVADIVQYVEKHVH